MYLVRIVTLKGYCIPKDKTRHGKVPNDACGNVRGKEKGHSLGFIPSHDCNPGNLKS